MTKQPATRRKQISPAASRLKGETPSKDLPQIAYFNMVSPDLL